MAAFRMLRPSQDASPQLVIRDIGTAYAFSQGLYVAAKLGIADLL